MKMYSGNANAITTKPVMLTVRVLGTTFGGGRAALLNMAADG